MFGTMKRGVNAYANVGLETGITSASPHTLIVMLYDGALAALMAAKGNLAAGNIAAKGSAISKAITIIDNGLRASLDQDAGGEIAANLDALYDYMSRRLLQANLKNDVGMLDEVHRLLGELRGAWVQIGDKAGQPAAAASAASPMPKAATLASA
ncbi:flagellar export chaperone FliS [Massilia forsythiae]|uniref:Flagellar secretion chaperone FliS n=1 Tax=Massilia forsythiae TaxID=2728020 RepID=A0A7Z2VY18_9BURK|nr:flagellar export chaperone FliS [Massilia forsythiae]QJE00952.1 flagellar export chaperone FliS [Massilia forsythiae]